MQTLKEKVENLEKILEEIVGDLDPESVQKVGEAIEKLVEAKSEEESTEKPSVEELTKESKEEIETKTRQAISDIKAAKGDMSNILIEMCKVLEDELGINLLPLRKKIETTLRWE